MKRKATAVWLGNVKDGHGHLTTQSTVLDQTQYSFSSRFADGKGTNPEELLAAAHAGCFNMKLSYELQEAGFTVTELNTVGTVTVEISGIKQSHLKLNAQVPGISAEEFDKFVKLAENECPVSQLFDTEIVVEYVLKG